MGVFESVFLIPLNLSVPALGQGGSVWSAPLVVVFFAAFAAALLGVAIGEKRIARRRDPNRSDALRMRGATAAMLVGMLGMLAGSLNGDLLAVSLCGAAAEGTGAALCLVGFMGHLSKLLPDIAASMLCMALAMATVVLLAAGSIGSSWFIAGHIALVALAGAGWCFGLRNTPASARVTDPTSEVWGQYEKGHTGLATVQLALFASYGLLVVSAGSMRVAEGGDLLLLQTGVPGAVTLGGAAIYAIALAALMLLYGSRRALSVSRSARVVLVITGLSAFCIAYVPSLSFVAECLVLSALVYWSQVFLLMALPIMRSGVRSVGVAVGLPYAFLSLAAGLAAPLSRYLMEGVGIPVALFGATVLAMIVLCCCIRQAEPHFASSQQTAPQFLGDLAPEDAARFAPAIMRYGLTAREADVLPLLAGGLPATAIAEQLCISVPTVNSHIRHIYAKMDVHGREGLVAKLGERK